MLLYKIFHCFRQQDGRYSADESQLTHRNYNNSSNSRNNGTVDAKKDFRNYRAAIKHEKPRTQQSLERKTTDSVAIISEH